jgi:hypothetical protein
MEGWRWLQEKCLSDKCLHFRPETVEYQGDHLRKDLENARYTNGNLFTSSSVIFSGGHLRNAYVNGKTNVQIYIYCSLFSYLSKE